MVSNASCALNSLTNMLASDQISQKSSGTSINPLQRQRSGSVVRHQIRGITKTNGDSTHIAFTINSDCLRRNMK